MIGGRAFGGLAERAIALGGPVPWLLTHWKLVITGIGFALLGAYAAWATSRADHWHQKWVDLTAEAKGVLVAIANETGNPKLRWEDAPLQVRLLGKSRNEWKGASTQQSGYIRERAAEAARLKRLSAEAQQRAKTVIAKRDKLIDDLEQRAFTSAERDDCARQLREADDALNTVFEAGL